MSSAFTPHSGMIAAVPFTAEPDRDTILDGDTILAIIGHDDGSFSWDDRGGTFTVDWAARWQVVASLCHVCGMLVLPAEPSTVTSQAGHVLIVHAECVTPYERAATPPGVRVGCRHD